MSIDYNTGKNAVETESIEKPEINESINTAYVGTCQQMIESEIYFAPPEKDRVLEIISIDKKIELSDAEASENAVFVNGRIHKGIMYKTVKGQNNNNKENEGQKDNEQANDKQDKNKKDSEKKGKREASIKIADLIPIAVDGVVRHTTTWIPFRCYIPIEGAHTGDLCEIVSTELLDNGSRIKNIKYEDADVSAENDTTNEPAYIQGVIDTDVIKIVVKVIKL